METPEVLRRQYGTADPLKVRIETHRRYEERRIDLDAESRKLLCLSGAEALLDVGCGPGTFLAFLRRSGHKGRLVGLDQSPGMIAEARTSANREGLALEWLVGDAIDLPLPNAAFDWVVARHMLYHVPDIASALLEFGRVCRPSGGVFVTTNGRHSLPRIIELRNDMLAAFGFPPGTSSFIDSFCIENAAERLRAVYAYVHEVVLTNALIFTEPAPIVTYIASMFPSLSIPDDSRLWNELRRWLADEAQRRLDQMNGLWRDPKDVGLYVCKP